MTVIVEYFHHAKARRREGVVIAAKPFSKLVPVKMRYLEQTETCGAKRRLGVFA
jgi:hypothetical protein